MEILRIIFSLFWKTHVFIVFVLTTIFFYPLIVPLLFSERLKKHTFKFFIAWSWCIRVFCFYFVIKKLDSPLPQSPYIIVANHISYLDIFLMPSILPNNRFLFLGKSELLKYPLIKHNGVFKKTSWKEALNFVAKKFSSIKKEYGPDSLVLWSSARVVTEANYLMQKFARVADQRKAKSTYNRWGKDKFKCNS